MADKMDNDIAAAIEAAAKGGAGHPMSERPPAFLTPKARARDADRGIPPADRPLQGQVQQRDTRDIRELAQRIDSLMFEIIERLENLNGWLGQLPRVK